MNPRQRRGALLMLLAGLSAVVVFGVVTSYVAEVNSQVGSEVTVYRAARALPAFASLTEGDLEMVSIPKRWVSDSALMADGELTGRKLGVNLERGTVVTRDVLVPPSELSPTEREIAINVDAVTGVAGRVAPGDLVDIYSVFAEVPGLTKQVRVLVRNVRVVSVGGRQTLDGSLEEVDEGPKDVVPVTLALEPNETLAVSYAAAFAKEVRLVRLPSGNTENRRGETDLYDARDLGGQPVPEGVR